MMGIFKNAISPETGESFGTGWLPPMPDLRDLSDQDPRIVAMNEKLGIPKDKPGKAIPASVDLRPWFSNVEDQKNLGSCTANAAVGVVEYFQRRGFGKHIDGSRLFIYKTTRNLMGVTGDTGAWLRNTMGALVLCGVPPERYWPYKVEDYELEPSNFVYAVADNYEALRYFCHDPLGSNVPKDKVLAKVKAYLACGIPSMFGFFGFPSFDSADIPGEIPFPCPSESAEWGHAIVAAGYDDKKKIKNKKCDKTTTGALLIRNSWGTGWGDKGYGWLPYEYVLQGLALDFWSLLSMEWVDTDKFGLQE